MTVGPNRPYTVCVRQTEKNRRGIGTPPASQDWETPRARAVHDAPSVIGKAAAILRLKAEVEGLVASAEERA